jgi:hypothetical protein
MATSNSQRNLSPAVRLTHSEQARRGHKRHPAGARMRNEACFARRHRGRLQAVSILICTQATAGLERESMQVHRMTSAVVPQSIVLNTACE